MRDGEAAVARTPEQLEVLRESGVVDAGGARPGGDPRRRRRRAARRRRRLAGGRRTTPRRPTPGPTTRTAGYRYCTNFIVTGDGPREPLVRPRCWRSSAIRSWSSATRRRSRSTSTPTSREAAVALFDRAGRGQPARRGRHARADRRADRAAAGRAMRGRRRGRGARDARALRGAGRVRRRRRARPSTPRSTTCSPRSTRCPREEVLVFPNNRERGHGGRAGGRALGQGGPGRPLHLAAGRAGRAGRARPDRLDRRQRRADDGRARRDPRRVGRARRAGRRQGPVRQGRRGRLRRRRDRRLGRRRVDPRRDDGQRSPTAPRSSPSSAARARRSRSRSSRAMLRRASSSSCTRAASRTTGGCSRRSDVSAGLPVLWQYSFSNYNEKARWALDFKGIPHRRRSVMPGGIRGPLAFSRGNGTLPVDRSSTEGGSSTPPRSSRRSRRRQPEPALYPADPDGAAAGARARGPSSTSTPATTCAVSVSGNFARTWHYGLDFMTTDQPTIKARVAGCAYDWHFPVVWRYMNRRYGLHRGGGRAQQGNPAAALDRIESERNGRDYLVGESFTVADLTASALLYPMVWPPEFPYELPEPRRWEFLEPIRDHPALEWIREMWGRHRGTSAAV